MSTVNAGRPDDGTFGDGGGRDGERGDSSDVDSEGIPESMRSARDFLVSSAFSKADAAPWL
jgi:hypothetical protein